MKENQLLLEMHWMKKFRGTLVLKSPNYAVSVKLKGICDAPDFIARLNQLAIVLKSGADLNDHLEMSNGKATKRWVLHLRANCTGVSLMLMRVDEGVTKECKPLFVWSGSKRQFGNSINHLNFYVGNYPFFEEEQEAALRLKWQDWVDIDWPCQ